MVYGRCYIYAIPSSINRHLSTLTDYDSILEVYTLPELIELNDLSEAEVLEVLVEAGVVDLPEILPLEFDDEASN